MQDNKETKERVFALESELTDLQPRLAQTGSLLEKVATLERELLVLNQLYRDTREESLSLLARSRAKQEWVRLTNTLKQEKEGNFDSNLCPPVLHIAHPFYYTLTVCRYVWGVEVLT